MTVAEEFGICLAIRGLPVQARALSRLFCLATMPLSVQGSCEYNVAV